MELKEAIQNRKSHRDFCNIPLTDEQLKLFHWAIYKIPSAGALYPLDIKVAMQPDGVTAFIICADFSKTTVKYGERGIRYVYMEAGHTAQNICLLATELGLGSVCIGAFDDAKLKEMLKSKEDPIYMVLVGNKRSIIC